VGVGVIFFQFVLHQPINWTVQAMAFIVLVAVGADYNLLLISRIREESRSGIRSGIIRAVRSTGGVITSAGIIFAASMFGLLFGSVSTMTQIGFIIGMGLLIDTFVVRTITVPAMAAMVGMANWWPSKATHATDAPDTTESTDTEVAPSAAKIPVQAVAKSLQGDFSHRLATNNIRRSAARRRRTLTQHGKRVRRLSGAGGTYSFSQHRAGACSRHRGVAKAEHAQPGPGTCHYRTAANGKTLPHPTRTPDATNPKVTEATVADTICETGYTKSVSSPLSPAPPVAAVSPRTPSSTMRKTSKSLVAWLLRTSASRPLPIRSFEPNRVSGPSSTSTPRRSPPCSLSQN
jgi:hypothetical protein